MTVSDPSADNRHNVDFFTGLLARHKLSPLSLNWGSRESQELRFAVLAAVGLFEGASVLDVGCGLGDFYSWQKTQGIGLNYEGVDLTPGMVETAKQRFPEVTFRVSDVLHEPAGEHDFIIASGIFYLRRHDPVGFLERMISTLFSSCRLGLAFNSLSAWSPAQNNDEFYADPLRTLEFCRTLTPWVVLRHDYHPGDFTIYLRRHPVRL